MTAQKREENLQKVPITISALTSAALESTGIKASTELGQVVPNLAMYQQATSVTPFIRGIGTKNSVAGDENAVALYVDGAYIASAAASVFSLNNIERIEVLKGPQGTLFGRNATAGVIQVVTKQPSHAAAVDASIGYDNLGTLETNLYGTVGVTDDVATDLAVYYDDQQEGWGTNLANGRDVHRGKEFSIRNKWLIDAGEDTQITLAADYNDQIPVSASIYRALPGQLLTGGIGYPGFYDTNVDFDDPGRTRQWGLFGKIEHELSWARLVSISSYRDLNAKVRFDEGTPALIQHARISQQSRNWSQEVQLLSPADSTLQWILGAYYFHDVSGVQPFNINIRGNITDRYAEQRSDSYAAFGQATLPVTDATKITAGLRYTIDDRELTGRNVPAGGAAVTVAPQDATFNKLTWRLAVDHEFHDSLLGYAAASRGFKSGVFNLFGATQPAVRPQVLDTYEIGFKTDLLDHTLRVNAAAFMNYFDDIQLQIPVTGGTQLYNAAEGTSKGVEIEIEALVLDGLSLRSSVGYLDSEYTNFPAAPYFRPVPGGGLQTYSGNAKGNEFIIAPSWTASLSAQYRLPTDVGDFIFALSDSYNGGFYFDVENRIAQRAYHVLNSALEWNAPGGTWGLELWAKNLGKTRYYANIVPGTYGDTALPAEPRTYGARVRVSF